MEFVAWDEGLYRRYLERGEWHDAAGGYLRVIPPPLLILLTLKGDRIDAFVELSYITK